MKPLNTARSHSPRRFLTVLALLGTVVLGLIADGSVTRAAGVPDLSAQWWVWALGQGDNVAPNNAITGTTPADCRVHQAGPVWFLAASTTPSTRYCTIPSRKQILFPIVNAEWSVLEAQAQAQATPGETCFLPGVKPSGTLDGALRACARAAIDLVDRTGVEAEVDGVPIPGLQVNTARYRKSSPPFDFAAVSGNAIGVPAGPNHAVSDGYWVLLDPLSAGPHTLHFRGTISSFGLVFEATYHLTIRGEVCEQTGRHEGEC